MDYCVFKNFRDISNYGGIYRLEAGRLIESNNVYTNITVSEEGGVYFLAQNASLTAYFNSYNECAAPRGGVFFLEGTSLISISHSIFSNNTSSERGGVLYFSQAGSFMFNKS